MGPSGSGKTTLLNLIGGLDTPTSGEITVAGQRLDQLSSGQLARWRANHVGFVFQFYNLMPMLNAQRNVELPLLLTHLSAAKRAANAMAALTLVGVADRAKHKPERALRRPGAARRDRAGAGRGSEASGVRRAHRRSGPQIRRRGAASAADPESRARQDRRHRHPRPEGRGIRAAVMLHMDKGALAGSPGTLA